MRRRLQSRRQRSVLTLSSDESMPQTGAVTLSGDENLPPFSVVTRTHVAKASPIREVISTSDVKAPLFLKSYIVGRQKAAAAAARLHRVVLL